MARSVILLKEKQGIVSLRLHEQFLSQQDFAEYAEVSPSTVSNFINSKPVDRIVFIKICEKLGIEDWRVYASSPSQLINKAKPTEAPIQQVKQVESKATSDILEYPEGQMQVNSPFYIERPPIEARCYEQIAQPGALIRIKAPRQMGKSSLLARILHKAEQQGDKTIHLSLQSAATRCFCDAETFLKWFCVSLARALQLPPNLDEYWELAAVMGGNLCCQDYLERYLLPKINQPITLGLDEVDRVFEYPEISSDFFGLLRVLHEEGKQRKIWKRLRLIIVHSTEVYVPINLNQSPFNVGLPIELPEFTLEQVLSLAQIHKLDWSETQVLQLMEMVGGHPFLVRLALYHIAREDITLKELLETAPTTTGIYRTYLRRIESILEEHPELEAGMEELIRNTKQAQLSNKTRSKLEALGLIKVENGETLPSCELYRRYFFN